MSRTALLIIAAATLVVAVAACADPDPSLGGRAALGVGDDAVVVIPPEGDDAPADTTVSNGSVQDPTEEAIETTTTLLTTGADAGVAVTPVGGTPLHQEPGGEPFIQLHEGITMGFQSRSGDWLEVMTPCNETHWVAESDVTVTPQSAPGATPGPGFDLASAVIMLDPGHGGRDWGGVGPTNLGEKHVNLDIAERVRDLMEASQTVDWSTGDITPGSDIPAFGTVWLTRDRSGPDDGDYEIGLAFRATLANAAGADAFISIHNNTVPRIDTDIPGTEVYYALSVEDSDRLASLIYVELLRGFSDFTADWKGGERVGARGRYDPATEEDYYGLFQRTVMPAVIVEGIYIDQPDTEELLRDDAFLQAWAEGVYRGVVRFFTTDDVGEPIHPPEPFPDDAGAASTSGCELPAQS